MGKIPTLMDTSIKFPETSQALEDPNGLLAAGGTLDKETLLSAYQSGIFPWFEDNSPILWWSPNPRCILQPEGFAPSKSLKRKARKGGFEIRIDSCFEEVIDNCKRVHRKKQRGTWITNEMRDAYIELHHSGFAHSIECFTSNHLVAGLYGVSLGNLFFGESMFQRETDCSKLALVGLVQIMKENKSKMIDCQVSNPHLLSLGATEVTREKFLDLLHKGLLEKPIDWKKQSGKLKLEL
jgi:leucyl/phenylalanyl-tRNA--protein transferase